MDFNIRAGMRILYKQGNSNWMVGTIHNGNAEINEQGLWIPIVPIGATWEDEIHYSEVNQIFWDAFKLDDWIKDYPKYFMSKEDYIKFIESDEFDKRLENACVSDGEYGYYPVSKYSRQWLEKQPFDYIVRSD
jgi:hypothetical protein